MQETLKSIYWEERQKEMKTNKQRRRRKKRRDKTVRGRVGERLEKR